VTSHTGDEMTERQRLDVDILCVGFGPASGGFLTTLARLLQPGGVPRFDSRATDGLPLQVVCFERADDVAFGVSGIVTRARGLRASCPDLDPGAIPLATRVTRESLVYLLDPIGASVRSAGLRAADRLIRAAGRLLPYRHHALEMPFVPAFMEKKDGLVLSMGQFLQWVASQAMATGAVQIWPASPVAEPLFDGDRVTGVRLVDQGTDRAGRPEAGFAPGMDVHAALTVVGDGPVGAVGQALDARFGMPDGHHHREWALGMKMLVELPDEGRFEPGTVLHTFGYPEPGLFGFLYALTPSLVSLGIFVPSWFGSPVRTAYRYLQHWMRHPYLWPRLEGGTLRSWGAKSIQESGRRGEPFLAGDGYARIGEGSGSTNVLTGSGVDEAWTTGALLAEAVVELLERGEPFTREGLERAYVARRRASWVEREARVAERARDGFERGVVPGLVGMALAAWSGGRVGFRSEVRAPREHVRSFEQHFAGRIPPAELSAIRADCDARGVPLHDALMDRVGWPAIPYDGRLLLTHQDALLVGGKVQAPPGYADHVTVIDPVVCGSCGARVCIEACSGEALTPGAGGVPLFDREKCVHCGACLWNCAGDRGTDTRGNLAFRAGAGGLHSSEN
jgi:electron-transferring-flavoprotein dehydrogenase